MSCEENPLDDIEDIIGQEHASPRDRLAHRGQVAPKVKRTKKQKKENAFIEPVIADSIIPGYVLVKLATP